MPDQKRSPDWRAALAIGLVTGAALGAVSALWWTRSKEAPAPAAAPVQETAAPVVTPPQPASEPAPEWPVPTKPGPDLHSLRAAADLRARFDQALLASKVVGEIVRVDCSELPCITYGAVDEAQSPDQILEATPLNAGTAGQRILFRWDSKPDGSPYQWRLFAVAWLPPDMEGEARLAARDSVTRRYRAARIEGLKVGSRAEKR